MGMPASFPPSAFRSFLPKLCQPFRTVGLLDLWPGWRPGRQRSSPFPRFYIVLAGPESPFIDLRPAYPPPSTPPRSSCKERISLFVIPWLPKPSDLHARSESVTSLLFFKIAFHLSSTGEVGHFLRRMPSDAPPLKLVLPACRFRNGQMKTLVEVFRREQPLPPS